MNKPTFYVTTPIYYVNDVPHIGHAYTTVAADVISRYKRLSGYDVFFLTGTDEHGQKIEMAAEKQGITPKQLADKVVERFKNLWIKLNISYDKFIRTTDDYHKKSVQYIFKKMMDNGDIYQGEYEGWYCTPCETYWTETQLLDGNCCPSCRRETTRLKEPSYFFKMSKYQDALLKHIEENPDFIKPASRRNEIISFIKEGLRDLSVSRVSFKWGVQVPDDPKHVIYVWIDALTNYISALGYPNEDDLFGKYWPADFHIVGKDILRFHTVYWPTMLMSIGVPLPKSVFAHGWWTVEGQKMSKSLGNAIDPNWLVDKFGVDQIRYFLMREVPFGLDGDFSFKALIHRINGDLSNDLGNLLNRTLGMLNRYFDGVVQPYVVGDPEDDRIAELIVSTFKEMDKNLQDLAFNKALGTIWELVSALNKFIDTMAPWNLAKDPSKRDRLGSVLYVVLDGIRALSLMLYPFMPNTAIEMRRQLNTKREIYKSTFEELCKVRVLESGQKIGEVKQLFPRIDEENLQLEIKKENEETKHAELVDYDYFSKLELRAGKILTAEKVEKSEKLLKLKVDLGSEQRQIIAGIAKSYDPKDLVGKTVAIVANLKPAKLMGLISEGMVLAATSGDRHYILELPEDVKPGSVIK
ncbi:methionine--tRNA ligase [Calditerrivibrio nitroreducens]|uniref:Methionine--tRNA ligase n=1 Tax=Calditerrivibrio nitroreducens (strain DSM 19672 / NBRC 101217 / Yu37-1) TaxID=768670 RepID=E4THK7_CALNY|nr:methionine--tRNA ligase [Calditerrivibrio nitroreducens]ADR18832.1 methionyl-tRNA synthetase [Calditerrivibrio nitroreducens DSM 19672]